MPASDPIIVVPRLLQDKLLVRVQTAKQEEARLQEFDYGAPIGGAGDDIGMW